MEKGSKQYKIFLHFLKENDLLNKISKEQIGRGLKLGYNTLFDAEFSLRLFDKNIVWAETNQGFPFWYETHLKWAIFGYLNNLFDKESAKSEITRVRGYADIARKYRTIFCKIIELE